jgi:cation diffusion facilitator family transporter
MSKHCCEHSVKLKLEEFSERFKKILYIALVLNVLMFFVEIYQGYLSNSLSLKADAVDFLGDSVNYFMTLFVITSSVKTKAGISLLKSFFMLSFGLWILAEALMRYFSQNIPDSFTMSWVGSLALIVNSFVAVLMYKFREGDSNMQSAWLCSRNDAMGNLAVIFASFGVLYFNSKWPDLIVALFMSYLSITSAIIVLKLARKEIIGEQGAQCVQS